MLLKDGKYTAKLSGPSEVSKSGIVIYETKDGALCASLPCQVAEGEHVGVDIKHTMTMVKKDGTIQTKTTDTLKEVFGWDGSDPFALMDAEYPEVQFEIVVENVQGQNKDGTPTIDEHGQPILFSKIKWLNPSGAGLKMPEPADRRQVLAKYGSKFRALSGGVSKTPPAKPAPVAKGPPAPPSGPTATMEEAWAAFCDYNKAIPEAEMAAVWFKSLKALFGTENNTEVTPQQWHQMKEKYSDNLPG